MKFAGFGEHAVEFYDGLVVDNSKAYWEDNRKRYEADVRAPMEALLAELTAEFAPGFGGGEPGAGARRGAGAAKVFRPYRDVRFAKDKSPYKTHCGGVIEQGRGGGAYYVEVSSAGLRVGGGCFHLESDQLARFRQAVDAEVHGAALAKLLGRLRSSGWTITGEALRTRPRGVAADHPRLELLRHRSLYAVRTWDPDDTLHERDCLDRVRRAWRQLRPFNEWARDHVGPTDRPRR